MDKGLDLQVQGITVCRKGKIILDDISFKIRPNTLTAIIGPNGAGKTTLMKALTGERPDEGCVFIKGQDIYQEPEIWLRKIGYVPVDNILHGYLTLQEALLYIGRLRLPNRTLEQIQTQVDSLLTDFGFPPEDDRRNKQIRVLSSGELKRANVCSELIIDPPILMLDEPTSNMDPNAENRLMEMLANYAHQNHKTILVITHTLNALDLCDDVIYIENARLKAMGKPAEVLDALLRELNIHLPPGKYPFYQWAQVFEQTKTQPEKRKKCTNSKSVQRLKRSSKLHSSPTEWFSQYSLLLRRYMKARLGDPWTLLGTLLAGFSGILFFTFPGNVFVKPFDPNERLLALNQARQAVYLVSLVVTFLGMITSYTEISKEFRIYSHERLKGLSPSAYILAKWTWLIVFVGVLAPVVLLFFIIFVWHQPLPGFPEARFGQVLSWWNQLVRIQLVGLFSSEVSWLVLSTMILTCITSVTLGLLISCAAGDGGKGYLYLSFTVVFIVLFSGLIRNLKLESLINTLSFFSTGKWAYEGLASSIGIYCWTDSWRFDEFNSSGHMLSIWLSLVLFILVSLILSVALLHWRDPWYSRWSNLKLLFARNGRRSWFLLSILVLLFSYALFLRSLSYEYHALNYWSRAEYGGTNAYQYANVQKASDPTPAQFLGGIISQSWCGNLSQGQ